MADYEFECKSKSAAMTVLKTITEVVERGTQRNAIIAVMKWLDENYPNDFDDETKKRIQSIYDTYCDEAGQKAITWQVHGGEPEHGTRAEVPYIFNAETKTWELEKEMPPVWIEPNPNILQKAEYEPENDPY